MHTNKPFVFNSCPFVFIRGPSGFGLFQQPVQRAAANFSSPSGPWVRDLTGQSFLSLVGGRLKIPIKRGPGFERNQLDKKSPSPPSSRLYGCPPPLRRATGNSAFRGHRIGRSSATFPWTPEISDSEPRVSERSIPMSGRPLPDGRGSVPGVVVRSDAPADSRTCADVPLLCRAVPTVASTWRK